MWHCMCAGIAHPSENGTDSSASSSIQARLFFKCDSVCLQVTDVHWFLLFSFCGVLFTKWAIGLFGMAEREGMLWWSGQSSQVFKLETQWYDLNWSFNDRFFWGGESICGGLFCFLFFFFSPAGWNGVSSLGFPYVFRWCWKLSRQLLGLSNF